MIIAIEELDGVGKNIHFCKVSGLRFSNTPEKFGEMDWEGEEF